MKTPGRLVVSAVLFVLLVFGRSQDAEAGAEAFCSRSALVSKTFANGTKWSFCWEIRAYEGLIVRHAFFRTSPAQGSVERRILWRAHVAELFVPYDAGAPRYTDVHYGLGAGTLTLTPADCPAASPPEERTLLLAIRPGGPPTPEALACREVRDRGTAFIFSLPASRKRGQELAIWASHQIGNYNYVFRWSFSDDGAIRAQAGLTGRQHIPGAAHTHNIYWRMDFDLAGFANDRVEKFAHTPTPPTAADSWTPILTEAEEAVDPGTFRSWRVRDTVVTNRQGKPISYELVPSFEGIFRGTGPEVFAQADFWVTRYKGCELYATLNKAKPFNVNCPTSNLREFISLPAAEAIGSTDVVLWYALHLHHLPRDEDNVNMPIHWVELLFRPRDFFNRNPFE